VRGGKEENLVKSLGGKEFIKKGGYAHMLLEKRVKKSSRLVEMQPRSMELCLGVSWGSKRRGKISCERKGRADSSDRSLKPDGGV